MRAAAVALTSMKSGATTAGATTATTLLASSNNATGHHPLLYNGYNLNNHSPATPVSNPSQQDHQSSLFFSYPLSSATTASVPTSNGVGNGSNSIADSADLSALNATSSAAELAAKVVSPFASVQQQQQSTGLNSPASTLILTGSFNNFLASQVPTIQHQHPHINDSDFPQLGGWTPSFGTGGGGGINLSSSSVAAAAANNSYRNVAGAASPIVQHGAPVFTLPHSAHIHQHQALFNRVADGSMHNHVMPLRPYANLMREGTTTEFRIQNEDFPALPGSGSEQSTTHANHTGGGGPLQSMKSLENSLMSVTTGETPSNIVGEKLMRSGDPSSHQYNATTTATAAALSPTEVGKQQPQQGIQTHPDGLVTNIPPNMLDDQFGMAGLLTFLRTIESDPSIVELALGHDLTALGLNLNSPKRTLYQSFGPWATLPCRVQDLDAKVPDDYLTNATIGQKLPNIKVIKLNKLALDVLFYLFYNCPGEVYQVAAASELYARSWRYHMSEKVWLTRSTPANPPQEHTGSYEKSSYTVFDPVQWRLTTREMMLEYKQLEGKPNSVNNNGAVNVSTPSSASGAGPMMQSAMSAYGADGVEGGRK